MKQIYKYKIGDCNVLEELLLGKVVDYKLNISTVLWFQIKERQF